MPQLGDSSIWPPDGTMCAIDPCGQLAVMPGPMCFTHFKIMPRPHAQRIKDAIALSDVASQRDAVTAATARVQETVDRIRGAIEQVETGRV